MEVKYVLSHLQGAADVGMLLVVHGRKEGPT